MGVCRLAGRLSSRNRKISSGITISPRRCSNLAAIGESEGEEKKSLYLCFRDAYRSGSSYLDQVVRPIRLNGRYDDDEEELLGESSRKKFWFNKSLNSCSTFGTKIVFPNGRSSRELWSFDTTKQPPRLSQIKTLPEDDYLKRNYGNDAKCVVMGEIDGKLYRFDEDICLSNSYPDFFNFFDVIDPLDRKNRRIWRPLHKPPFMPSKFDNNYDYNVAFLNSSKKILGWELNEKGVFCFDTSEPDDGWTRVPPAVSDTLPLMNIRYKRPYFIHKHHSDLGDFHICLYYDPDKEPLLVTPFFLPNNFESFQPIDNHPVHLPIICHEYLPLRPTKQNCSLRHNCDFVDMGYNKFGLVFNKFFGTHHAKPTQGFVLLVTFEYDIIIHTTEQSKPTIEIQTRLLGTRRFHYRSKTVIPYGCTDCDLNGAFFL